MLSIWESGTVGRIGVQVGGEEETGRWCFICVIGCAMASSKALALPQDAEFIFTHNGLYKNMYMLVIIYFISCG